MPLDRDLESFATSDNFGAFTTLGPDGMPSTHVMWVDADGEHVLLNTEVHRQKYKNVQRDPRVTVTVIDKENPYRYVEARGRVVSEAGGQEARDHIDACSRKYTGSDYANPIQSERVILRVAVDKVHKMGV
jgi:PPOX class probable F420-dependent enzyme